jgi:hypothetical protein
MILYETYTREFTDIVDTLNAKCQMPSGGNFSET